METNKLNEDQIKAIKHFNGPMMVLAGPGSGKTTVITYRIKHLMEVHNVPIHEILVITFTKATAEEMKNRFLHLVRDDFINPNRLNIGTFHSFFFKILRGYYGYSIDNILSEESKYEVIKSIIRNLNIKFEDEQDFIQNLINELSLVKNELIDISYYNPMNCGTDDFQKISEAYEEYKLTHDKIDFDDMLIKCFHLLNNDPNLLRKTQNKYKYILVDEFQDINRTQYETIKLISKLNNNIFIVGDDDQSIYKFRGASPEFLLRFPNEFENVSSVTLNVNYRSTDNLIRYCLRVISRNKKRYEKSLIGTNMKGQDPILISSEDVSEEALLIAKKIVEYREKNVDLNNIAVTYRTNIQARSLIDAFMDFNINYFIKDDVPNIYSHFIAIDIISYLKLALDDGMMLNKEFERIINRPKRYMSKVFISTAKNIEGSMFKNLYTNPSLQYWQKQRLDELKYHLQILKKRSPYEAVRFIRQTIGYDDYIREYAEYRKIGTKNLYEIADEVLESTKNHKTFQDFIVHIENINIEVQALIADKKRKNTNGVTLSTLHSIKGLEFDIVFITTVIEGVIPYEKSKLESEIEEERRLFYVGMTRAKKILYLSTIKSRYENSAKISRFLTTEEERKK